MSPFPPNSKKNRDCCFVWFVWLLFTSPAFLQASPSLPPFLLAASASTVIPGISGTLYMIYKTLPKTEGRQLSSHMYHSGRQLTRLHV